MTPETRDLLCRMAHELDHYLQLLTDNRLELHSLATEARRLLAQSEWQPMDTAPKDGTLILAHDYDTLACVSWDGEEWMCEGRSYFPAEWQHLPTIPEAPQ